MHKCAEESLGAMLAGDRLVVHDPSGPLSVIEWSVSRDHMEIPVVERISDCVIRWLAKDAWHP
jgi:hypothetical protein